MTCLICGKCHSHDFEQLPPFYGKEGLTQVFKCKTCGEEIHLNPAFSGIMMSFSSTIMPLGEFDYVRQPTFLAETIRHLWKAIEDLEGKLNGGEKYI